MNEQRRSHLDFLQNILIVALSLSAVVLLAQTQLFHLGTAAVSQQLAPLMAAPNQTDLPSAGETAPLAAPVHVAVTGAYGRYGNLTLVTSGEEFRPLGDLLKEALGSARPYTVCTEADFLDALDNTSIYYDFLAPLPLSVLAELCGISVESSDPVQRLILAETSDLGTTRLYTWSSEGGYRYCSTAVSRSNLESIAGGYELGNAVFAYELAEADSAYTAVDPCSLFLSETLPELPLLQVSQSAAGTDQLLTALHFNPRTNYRYPESDGTEVVVEGERSLRIRPDGTLFYRGGSESLLTISAADPFAPTLQESAYGTAALLRQLLANPGDTQLYLQNIHQSDSSTMLQFGYHVNGIPIHFSDGGAAAEVTLTGSAVSRLSLRPRQYTMTGESSLLLPLRQALAIAADGSRAELSIGYADNGAAALSACWLAE